MATKTVVCPECGSPTAPGRYTCSECGTLLAAVGLTGRGWTAMDAGDPIADDTFGDEPERERSDAAAPQPSAAASERAADAADAASAAPAELGAEPPDEPARPAELPAARPPSPFDGLGASRRDREPDKHSAAEHVDDEAEVAAPRPVARVAAAAAVPTSPPSGDTGPATTTEPRTPAGAYLPPSAVLPPLDMPSSAVAAAVSAAPAVRPRPSFSIDGLAGRFSVPVDAARRVIAIGAAMAAVAFVLPWVNGLPGSGLDGYFSRWGLAAPGLWLVLLALIGLAALAVSSGRPAAWPLAIPAIVAGAFLVGLAWPYLFGSSRAIGIWLIVVGGGVLIAGGLLERRARHAPREPSV